MDLLRSICSASLMLAVGIATPAGAQPAAPAAQPADQAQTQAPPAETPPEKRFALVIGNGQYRALRAVPGAAISARRVAEALRRAGFEVEEATDLDRAGLEAAVRQLATRLDDAHVAAVYYAGRSGTGSQGSGLCMEPVDAPARESTPFAFECVPFGAVLGQLERHARAGLVFWDAELPARRGPQGSGGATRARSMLVSGQAMLFAAQPGEAVANPDASEQVSPFADALANALSNPGLDVLELLRQVRRDVRGATNDAQTPWFRYGLDDELVLVPRPAPQPVVEAPAPAASFSLAWQTRTPPPDPAALELAAWNAVVTMRSDNARRAGLMDFLQRFPTGQYASLARINLDDLDRPAAPTASQPPDPLTVELAEWQSVQAIAATPQRTGALQGYLQRYPNGRFAAVARLQLADMTEPAPPPPVAASAAAQPPGAAAAAQQAAQQAAAQQAAAQQAAGPQQRYIVTRQVPLRGEANQESRILRTLQPFTLVLARGRIARDQWIEVQVGNERGFLFGGNMRDFGEAEEEEWARIQGSRDRAAYETFLRRFPGGAFANEAARRRDQFARAPAQPPRPPAPPQPQPASE